MSAAPLNLALDIGTRSLVALAFEERGSSIIVKRIAAREHASRVMRDGQVEDVAAVAEEIRLLIEELCAGAEDLAIAREATVAVAGRSLKTMRGAAEESFESPRVIDEALYGRLVSEALFNAAMGLENPSLYHGVGHVVAAQRRGGEDVLRLVGQTAKSIEVEVLATFLREDAVEGKFAALAGAGLTVESISLEPVAVLRLLQSPAEPMTAVLVDIGGGTTDLAVTQEGYVRDFRMIPMAGDEVTQRIARRFLLPFEEAERIKRMDFAREKGTVQARGTSGGQRAIPIAEIQDECLECSAGFAESIADRLKEIGLSRLEAVFLVGGGALLHGLPEAVAKRLSLPLDRVFRRSAENLPGVVDETGLLKGPERVTPAAIACSRAKGHRPAEFVLGGERIRHLIRPKGCVAAELIPRSGRLKEIQALVGRSGPDLAVTLGGVDEVLIIPGSLGGLPCVTVNGRPADLAAILTGGETVEFLKGADGEPGRASARDLAGQAVSVRVELEGEWVEVPPLLRRVRGEGEALILRPDDPLRDGDHLRFDPAPTVRSLLVWRGADPERPLKTTGRVTVDDREVSLPERERQVYVGGRRAELDAPLADGDSVEIRLADPVRVRDVVTLPQTATAVRVRCNDREMTVLDAEKNVWRGGQSLGPDDIIEENDVITTPAKRARRLRLADLLGSGFEPPIPRKGERLILEVEGRPAGWETPLTEGARITLRVEAVS